MRTIEHFSQENLNTIASACLEQLRIPGSVLLLPTETVYGLVCAWNDDKARQRIYDMKQRERNKPMQALLANKEQLAKFAEGKIEDIEKLVDKFCPGPITIVFEPAPNKAKIGFRIPDHPLIKKLLQNYDLPLAATSANLSGEPAALSVKEAVANLAELPDLAIDAGLLPESNQASTVVEITANNFSILRQGPISEAQIKSCFSS